MKKILAYLLAVLMVVSVLAVPVSALDWTENQTVDENGNYTFDNAYGYVFNIDDVNGMINGEDATIITTEDAYMTSNPNWAINVLLCPAEDANVYTVGKVVVCPMSSAGGIDAGINFDNGNIVMLVHSSYSNPNGTNWEAKVAAMALKEGDRVTLSGIDLESGICDNGTVTVLKPGEEVDSDTDTLPDTLYVPVTGFETPCSYLDGEVIVWNAGGSDRVITSEDAHLRYSWFLVTNSEGKVIKLGNNLVVNNSAFPVDRVTVPAGGQLIAFFYTESSPSNKILMAVYNEALLVSNNGEAIYNTYIDVESDYYIYVEDDKLAISRTQRDESDTDPDAGETDEESPEYTDGTVIYLNGINRGASASSSAIITNEEAYISVWPDMSYSFLLSPTKEENIYDVILDLGMVSAEKGLSSGINFDNGNIALLVGGYDDGSGCAAYDVKVGCKVRLDNVDLVNETEDRGTVTVLIPKTDDDTTEPLSSINLVPEHENWNVLGEGYLTFENGAPTIHAYNRWPSAETYYSNPITVNINDWYLEYDFTCTGTTNINFFFQDGEAYSFCNTALDIPAELFDTSGDLPSGSYSGKVALVDIVNSCQHYASKPFPSYLIQNDTLTFYGINFFAVGEEVSTTVNKFRLVSDTATVPDVPELPLEDQLIIDLGEANADSNLDVIINAPDYYKAGDEITVEVTIQNVSAKIHALEFMLKYDSRKLWLMNDLDEWENNALMCVTLPDGWENFSTVANDYADKKEELDRVQNDDDETNDESVQILPVNDGIINASILTVSTTARDAINSITFTFTFKALEDSEGELGFVIPHDSVECARNISTGVNIMNGNGSYAITHIAAILEGYDATCTEDGLTDGLYCPDCGYIIVEQEVIPAHGHDDGEWITVIEPGIGTEGLEELYCTICWEWLDSNVLPALCNPGDVTNDGIINTYDYILIKRHVMGTYELEGIALIAADVTADDVINTYDYILVKRHVMGTFEIEIPNAPEIPDTLPEFTNQFITLGPVSATDRATDSDAIRLTGVNVEPTYGSIVLFTREYGEITPENGLVDFEVVRFEYDHDAFGYVAQEGIGVGFKIVDIPEDGFVLAVHSSQTEYVKRLPPYLGGPTAFPHGVHVYTGNDFTVEYAESGLLTFGGFVDNQWNEYFVNSVDPSNVGWSYEQLDANNYHTTAKYYSAYDENYLYLQVVVDSPYHYCPLTWSNASNMWAYTSLQVNISSESPDSAYIAENFNHYSNQSAANNGVVYQYGFAVSVSDGSLSYCWIGNNDLGIIYDCYNDGDYTTYQIAIPFAKLGVSPESGAKLGLSFSLNVGGISMGSFSNIPPRNGGGIIGNNDWSKMFVVTLG